MPSGYTKSDSENDSNENLGSDIDSELDAPNYKKNSKVESKSSKKNIQHHKDSSSESSSEEDIDETIEGDESNNRIETLSNSKRSDESQQEPSFLQTEITYLITGTINELHDSRNVECCTKAENLQIHVMNKDGNLFKLKGPQLTKSIEVVEYDNRFPIALAVNVAIPDVKKNNVSYSANGVDGHVIAFSNRLKDNVNKQVFTADTRRGERFLKKFPGVKVDTLRNNIHPVEDLYLIKKSHPLIEMILVELEDAERKGKKSAITLVEGAHGFYHVDKKTADTLLDGLERDMRKYMPVIDLSKIEVQVQPAFPTEKQSSEREEVKDVSWLHAKELVAESRAEIRNSKVRTPHQLYVTLRITHCPASN